MKRFIRIVVGGKIGAVTWAFAITAFVICYFVIGGATGVLIGALLAKISWIPYLFGVVRVISEPPAATGK